MKVTLLFYSAYTSSYPLRYSHPHCVEREIGKARRNLAKVHAKARLELRKFLAFRLVARPLEKITTLRSKNAHAVCTLNSKHKPFPLARQVQAQTKSWDFVTTGINSICETGLAWKPNLYN